MVAVVTVEEDHDLRRVVDEVSKRLQTGRPVSALGLVDKLGAVFEGPLRRAIGRAVVGNDHPPNQRPRDVTEDAGKGLFFVQCRNDDVDVWHAVNVRCPCGIVMATYGPCGPGPRQASA